MIIITNMVFHIYLKNNKQWRISFVPLKINARQKISISHNVQYISKHLSFVCTFVYSTLKDEE